MASEEENNAELEKWLDNFTDYVFTTSQERIVKNKSVDTGYLLRSGSVERRKLERIIVYDAPHASAIEYGALQHSVPVKALEKWAVRKLGVKPKEANKVAWAIHQKILKEGVEEKPFLRPAMYDAISKAKLKRQ